MPASNKFFPVARVTEDGVTHLMPYTEARLSNRTACGFDNATFDRHLGRGRASVTCGACRETKLFKEES